MKILLLTTVYPWPKDKNYKYTTKVVEYFAQEWNKKGHEVLIIHNKTKYPKIVGCLSEKMRLKLTAKIGFLISQGNDSVDDYRCDNGIKIYKVPIKKYIPYVGFSDRTIKKQLSKIIDIMDKNQFKPDIIMGHWMNPQLQLIDSLKKVYGCPTSLVLHGDKNFKILLRNDYWKKYIDGIDAIGCRSKTEVRYLQENVGVQKPSFVCYSGVPDEFIASSFCNVYKFIKEPSTWRFVFVGRLVAYKNTDKVLIALSKVRNQNYTFDIIGTGYEQDNLIELSKKLGIEDKIFFRGQLPREQVMEYLRESHVFVMIPKGEAFGLVYLEAMAASCIAIGSVGEGIDGVIEHKRNGLLCTPADSDELTDILNELMESDVRTLQEYVSCGYETATAFTDSKVANRYLQDAFGIIAD